MKPVRLGRTDTPQQINQAFRKIEQASREERFVDIAASFNVDNVVETRSIDVNTATATDVANFLGTLLQELKRGRSVNP